MIDHFIKHFERSIQVVWCVNESACITRYTLFLLVEFLEARPATKVTVSFLASDLLELHIGKKEVIIPENVKSIGAWTL